MEDGYTNKSTETSTCVVDGTTIQTVTTILSKPDGTTKTIIETTTTKPDGSSSVSTKTNTEIVSREHAASETPQQCSVSAAAKVSVPINMETFRHQALTAHNERRAKHGVPPLTMSKELNDYAQNWADNLIKIGNTSHSDCKIGNKTVGENVAKVVSSDPEDDCTGEEATEQWYSEIAKFDFSKDFQKGTGHFTQVVWRSTTEMGMGKSRDGKGTIICVAVYFPAGNLEGAAWRQNIFPPK